MNYLEWIGRKITFLFLYISIVLVCVSCARTIEGNKVETEMDTDVTTEMKEEEENDSYFHLKSDQLLMEQYEEMLNTCVTIQCGGYRGEGSIFMIEEDAVYVVSVKHLLEKDSVAEVTFYDGISLQGEVAYLSEQYDFGFVKIEGGDQEWSQYGVVALPTENQLTYSHYVVIASLNGQDREETLVGTVLDPNKFFPEFNSFLIHHYCLVEPGMSGSGVFNENGEYQGILLGGLEQESVSLSYEYLKEEFALFIKE